MRKKQHFVYKPFNNLFLSTEDIDINIILIIEVTYYFY